MAAAANVQARMLLEDHAPAKINLTLRVLGRRKDGYHDLESLVAFAAYGDAVSLEPGEPLGLDIGGPMAGQIPADGDNLILRAALAFAARFPAATLGRFHLTKRLPIASGIGGGSSDAAAALRLLARANKLPENDPALFEIGGALGADIPVCLARKACVMRGVGERMAETTIAPALFAVLVNPGAPLATPAVFTELGLARDQRLRETATNAEAADFMRGVNDLEAPANRLMPAIGVVLDALRMQADCRFARMSGSGATCFGVFGDCKAAAAAAKAITAVQPNWWAVPTLIS